MQNTVSSGHINVSHLEKEAIELLAHAPGKPRARALKAKGKGK